jgi:hypothetical protein
MLQSAIQAAEKLAALKGHGFSRLGMVFFPFLVSWFFRSL